MIKKVIKNDLFFKRFGEFVRLCAFIKSYEKNEHTSIDKLIETNISRIYNDYIISKKFYQPDSIISFNPVIFNNAIELVINYSSDKEKKASEILKKISPFGDEGSKNRFKKLYSKENKIGGH